MNLSYLSIVFLSINDLVILESLFIKGLFGRSNFPGKLNLRKLPQKN